MSEVLFFYNFMGYDLKTLREMIENADAIIRTCNDPELVLEAIDMRAILKEEVAIWLAMNTNL